MSAPESKPKETPDEFLSRWSRRKQEARREEAEKPAAPPAPAAKDAAPELPPLDQLGIDSDYRGFLHPKVDEGLRRAALKKMFSDPHFNIMDGLDIYIDDYSITEPIPAAMLAELKQAQNILGWAKEDRENEARREAEALAKARGEPVSGRIAAAEDQQPAAAAPVEEQREAVKKPSRVADDGPQNT
ncbi:MAG: DUF3306 domain-containing protein [Burkholderiales bacterium]